MLVNKTEEHDPEEPVRKAAKAGHRKTKQATDVRSAGTMRRGT